MEKKKNKNYKRRAKTYKIIGKASTAVTTLGSFFAYESIIDWSNFKQNMEDFIVVNQENIKLNLAIAFPILISVVVFLAVFLKKNKKYFSDKISLGLLLAIIIMYMIYSTIEVALVSMIGAWVGVTADEVVFSPLSQRSQEIALEEKSIKSEFDKEKQRILARKAALYEDGTDGSV
jgi:hypothetical protein